VKTLGSGSWIFTIRFSDLIMVSRASIVSVIHILEVGKITHNDTKEYSMNTDKAQLQRELTLT
jgi:hypothetical protein